jgi:peptidoglycan L-alanyl-D-glutamate endopeptidase CwlK
VYKYSNKSKLKLEEAHPYLQILFNKVIEKYDISIVCASRDEETQNKYYNRGSSKVKYPNSKHNTLPYSLAVDFCPYHSTNGMSFNKDDAILVAGYIEGMADVMGIKVRIGCRWDHQWPSENTFMDAFHIELVLD